MGAGRLHAVVLSQRAEVRERALAQAQNVAPLRRAVVDLAERCGASVCQREDIAIAVSEALTNAIVHAYAGAQAPGVVEVGASMLDGSLHVVVRDEGVGMRPGRASRGLGFGLSLIARMTDHVRFEDAMPGFRVRMTFAVA
jgi:anti-sigma regulatory factor (Ser/Thr protein kinase)